MYKYFEKKYYIFIQDYYQRKGKLNQGYWLQVGYWKYLHMKLKGYKTRKETFS